MVKDWRAWPYMANTNDHGSSTRGKPRTSLTVTFLVGARLAARGASRLAYHFEGEEPPGFPEPPRASVGRSKLYRNPIALAQEWQAMLASGECTTRAAVARKLGVTRARVTQVLGLLKLAPQVIGALAALGDTLPRPIVTERSLRSLVKLPVKEQTRALQRIAAKAAAR